MNTGTGAASLALAAENRRTRAVRTGRTVQYLYFVNQSLPLSFFSLGRTNTTVSMGDSEDSLSREDPRDRKRPSSRKRERSTTKERREAKSRTRRDRDSDNSAPSSDDSYCRERKHRKHRKREGKKEKRKKDKKKSSSRRHREVDSSADENSSAVGLERNYALADALCDLFDGHHALASDFPIMLIRLAKGASFDLSQMTDSNAANGLTRVFSCLGPFGVEQNGSTWMWKNPAGSTLNNNELVLIRVVRAMLDHIGVTLKAVERFENPPAPKPPPSPKEAQRDTDQRRESSLDSAVEQNVIKLLKSFQAGGLSNELVGLCKMILEGEVVALDGLPDERLRLALESLFVSCGLEKSEMEVDSDDEEDEEDEKEKTGAVTGYGLHEKNNEGSKAMIASVIQVCRAKPAAIASRPIKGPMLNPAAYDNLQYTDKDNVSSDDDDGPLPLGSCARARASTLSKEQVKATAALRARQLACAKQGIELGPSDGNVREEWMIVPGKFDFFSAIKSGQPIRSRQFETKSKAEGTEPETTVDPAVEAEINAIRQAHEDARGPSLMEQHREIKKIEASQKQQSGKDSWKWNRDNDLDAGRRVDKDALNMILGGAGSDLKNKFRRSL